MNKTLINFRKILFKINAGFLVWPRAVPLRRIGCASIMAFNLCCIHILLDSSNIIFWNSAVEYGIVGPEIVVTVIHGLLVASNLASFASVQIMPTAINTTFGKN